MFVTSIDSVKAHYCPAPGRHWFDADTLRFFRSRLPQQVYRDGTYAQPGRFAYFVTSEKYANRFSGTNLPRKWSVRRYDYDERDISTIGEFQEYSSRNGADARARYLAEHGE